MGSAPEEQLEAEGQGISNDATQHKQHEYRVGLEEKLAWKSHLDQRHGCGNGEAKNAMVVGLLCWKVVDQQLLMIHELKINHTHIRKMIHCHVWLLPTVLESSREIYLGIRVGRCQAQRALFNITLTSWLLSPWLRC
ncbi:unnamed protein product [Prunus armeniaca]|uniref:Uncharacterized protein n=1 Tax=Prunus armeniaca TaxID=36596 RepID=A0A6J5U3C9_PRUAR|nr:unnamed protein product [Prunus armeniaca]